ncbi:DNA-directed RNA polymerase I subunit RPA1, partial [Aphis craccivora]
KKKGLLQPFPNNNLHLIIQSRTKGSTVDTIQISCCLGEIALEGKIPSMTISGRTLPSFPPFGTLPKAGEFICSRFMTDIQPQEFFFIALLVVNVLSIQLLRQVDVQFGFLADNVNSFKAIKKIGNDECYKELDKKLKEIKSAMKIKKKLFIEKVNY